MIKERNFNIDCESSNIKVNHGERGTNMFEQYDEVVTPQELSEMLRIGMNQTYKILYYYNILSEMLISRKNIA